MDELTQRHLKYESSSNLPAVHCHQRFVHSDGRAADLRVLPSGGRHPTPLTYGIPSNQQAFNDVFTRARSIRFHPQPLPIQATGRNQRGGMVARALFEKAWLQHREKRPACFGFVTFTVQSPACSFRTSLSRHVRFYFVVFQLPRTYPDGRQATLETAVGSEVRTNRKRNQVVLSLASCSL